MGLFSCQPELLIQSGFFLSLFLSIFFFFPVDFILGNGKVTGWHGWPSPRSPVASLTEAQPRPAPGQRGAAARPGERPGLYLRCWCCPWLGTAGREEPGSALRLCPV